MYDFTYHRASSVDEAVKLIKGADDGVFLAGGHTLVPTLKQRLAQPSDVIDLSGLGLDAISASGGGLTIGAAATHASVAASKDVAKACPALATLASHIGDPHVRARGTIGGSVANNDPSADYPAACLGMGATIVTNEREIAADDFFTGMFDTALNEGELITAVKFPAVDKAGYAKFANQASRYALVGVFVAQAGDDVRVAVTGAGPGVFRVPEMESALASNFSSDAIKGIAVSADDLNSDIHASAEYRAHLVNVMARRAVDQANG